jgi:hypothetical protein
LFSRKSNRTDIGYADSWLRPELNASNGVTNYRPISKTCKQFSTAENVSSAKLTNRNGLWCES